MSNMSARVNRLEERLEGLGSKPGQWGGVAMFFVDGGKVWDSDGNTFASVAEAEAAHKGAEMICVEFVHPGEVKDEPQG